MFNLYSDAVRNQIKIAILSIIKSTKENLKLKQAYTLKETELHCLSSHWLMRYGHVLYVVNLLWALQKLYHMIDEEYGHVLYVVNLLWALQKLYHMVDESMVIVCMLWIFSGALQKLYHMVDENMVMCCMLWIFSGTTETVSHGWWEYGHVLYVVNLLWALQKLYHMVDENMVHVLYVCESSLGTTETVITWLMRVWSCVVCCESSLGTTETVSHDWWEYGHVLYVVNLLWALQKLYHMVDVEYGHVLYVVNLLWALQKLYHMIDENMVMCCMLWIFSERYRKLYHMIDENMVMCCMLWIFSEHYRNCITWLMRVWSCVVCCESSLGTTETVSHDWWEYGSCVVCVNLLWALQKLYHMVDLNMVMLLYVVNLLWALQKLYHMVDEEYGHVLYVVNLLWALQKLYHMVDESMVMCCMLWIFSERYRNCITWLMRIWSCVVCCESSLGTTETVSHGWWEYGPVLYVVNLLWALQKLYHMVDENMVIVLCCESPLSATETVSHGWWEYGHVLYVVNLLWALQKLYHMVEENMVLCCMWIFSGH